MIDKGKNITYLTLILIIFFGCSPYRTLIERHQTDYGKIKFYFQTYENAPSDYRHLVAITKNLRYDFKQNQIMKQIGEEKGIFFDLYFGEVLIKEKKATLYPLTAIDSVVLHQADLMIDSLGMDNFQRAKEAKGFLKKEFSYLE